MTASEHSLVDKHLHSKKVSLVVLQCQIDAQQDSATTKRRSILLIEIILSHLFLFSVDAFDRHEVRL